jgi:16S rRNA (cytidine1402-2'-O)-methyltransferase
MERADEHDNPERTKPTLYVVATPIGNLRDVTLRALEIFKQVDVIAAEDTRVTSKLLDRYAIAAKKLIAVHEHNEQRTAPRIIAELQAGRSVALASDAGTPAFSDPGARLVAAVREAGYAVVPIPGANAAAAALSASGLVGPHFLFYGFLPSKAAERRKALEALAAFPYTLVFYEAPHRVLESIGDLAAVLGARRIVMARELTKIFESIHTCDLDEAAAWLAADPDRVRGEFVLMIEGAQRNQDATKAEAKRTLQILLEELPVKQAAALAARITGGRKNELYALALELKAVSGEP